MNDLWAALCLVLVLEGLFLFATPAVWKEMVAKLLEQPDRSLRQVGGFMVIAGLVALYFIRGVNGG
ncbi:MAG TPA: DUF2065 domain-containing protein [Arenimonas sp.]|nr:DUF2065 domain-containing protein [Arenimonas sp.]